MHAANLITGCLLYANMKNNDVTLLQTPRDFEQILQNSRAKKSKVVTIYVATTTIEFTNKGQWIRHEACEIGKTIHLGLEDY